MAGEEKQARRNTGEKPLKRRQGHRSAWGREGEEGGEAERKRGGEEERDGGRHKGRKERIAPSSLPPTAKGRRGNESEAEKETFLDSVWKKT